MPQSLICNSVHESIFNYQFSLIVLSFADYNLRFCLQCTSKAINVLNVMPVSVTTNSVCLRTTSAGHLVAVVVAHMARSG